MRNLLKMAAILLIIAVAFGCSSTNSSKSAATADMKSQSGEWPSGSIHFEEWQFMAMLAGNGAMERSATTVKPINLK